MVSYSVNSQMSDERADLQADEDHTNLIYE